MERLPQRGEHMQFRSRQRCRLCEKNDHSFTILTDDAGKSWFFCANCDLPDFREYKENP